MKKIQRIDSNSVKKLCASQVIVDLKGCLKELVDNALDSGATLIQILIVEDGANLIEVVDNGCGIHKNDLEILCHGHKTTKIKCFDDLHTDLSTLGFRGEALAALSTLGNLTIVSRTKNDHFGTQVIYDDKGCSKTVQTSISKDVGTTITLRDIFCRLPVRRLEFLNNIKTQLRLAVQFITGYAIIHSEVRFLFQSQPSIHSQKIISLVNTNGIQKSLRESVGAIYGPDFASQLIEVKGDSQKDDASSQWRIESLILPPVACCHRKQSRLSLVFVNKRLVHPESLKATVQQLAKLYRTLASGPISSPQYIINLQIVSAMIDWNVTPDKHTVFIKDESLIASSFIKEVEKALHGVIPVMLEEDIQQNITHKRLIFETQQTTSRTIENDIERKDDGNVKRLRPSIPKAIINDPPVPSKMQQSLNDNRYNDSSDNEKFEQPDNDSILYIAKKNGNETEKEKLNVEDDNNLHSYFKKRITQGRENETNESISDKNVIDHNNNSLTNNLIPESSGVFSTKNIKENTLDTISNLKKLSRDDNEFYYRGSKIIKKVYEWTPPPPPITPSLNSQLINNTLIKKDDYDTLQDNQQQYTSIDDDHQNNNNNNNNNNRHCLSIITSEQQQQQNEDDTTLLMLNESIEETHYETLYQQALKESQSEKCIATMIFEDNNIQQSIDSNNDTSKKKDKCYTNEDSNNNNQLLPFEPESLSLNETNYASKFIKFPKTLFHDICIIGQFNKGFIIGSLLNENSMELFIIDQHATDEKYKYERLYRTSEIQSQPLVAPLKLHILPADKETIRHNMNIFQLNGFRIRDDFKNDKEDHCESTLELIGLPLLHNRILTVEDFRELLELLNDIDITNTDSLKQSYVADNMSAEGIIRPSRVRYIMANWACRSAIMIGDPLSKIKMKTLVQRMASMNQPWNCPHGRPTMRHLKTISGKSPFIPYRP